MALVFDWKRHGGYYVDSVGDERFSAFRAMMADGRSLEQHYQCDVKGYSPGGTNWRLGKGKPPLLKLTEDELWKAYLTLWETWAQANPVLMGDLRAAVLAYHKDCPALDGKLYLSDRFASTPVNQAHALASILNYIETGKKDSLNDRSPH